MRPRRAARCRASCRRSHSSSFLAASWSSGARAADAEDADGIMRALAARPEGARADRTVRIKLIDRQGGVREQVARAVRKNVDDSRRMAIFYLAPANIRGTSFLVFDYGAARRCQRSVAIPAGAAQGAADSGLRSRRLLSRHGSDVRRDPQRQSRDARGLDVSARRDATTSTAPPVRSSKASRPASRSRASWATRGRAGAWTSEC